MASVVSPQHIEKVKEAFTNNRWYLSGYQANIRIRSEIVAELTGDKFTADIADLGCGDGSLSLGFLERGARVTFLDLSSAMLQDVATRIAVSDRPRATFINGDFLSSHLPDRSFDLVVFVGVLAYIEDLEYAASRLKRLLRPKGRLILEYTDASHPLARLNLFYRHLTSRFKAPVCTTFRHTKKQIEDVFSKASFRPTQSFHYAYTLPLVLRFLSNPNRYRLIKGVFGSVITPRSQRLGSEVLTIYQLTD